MNVNAPESPVAELPPISDRINSREAAALLDIDDDRLRQLEKRGMLSVYRIGKGPKRFLKSEVMALARASFRPATMAV